MLCNAQIIVLCVFQVVWTMKCMIKYAVGKCFYTLPGLCVNGRGFFSSNSMDLNDANETLSMRRKEIL